MKPIYLVPLIVVLLVRVCFAQNQTLPQQLNYLCAPLDKSQVQSGYLFDLSVPWVAPSQFNGTLNANNISNMDFFGAVYGEMLNARLNNGANLPSPTVYLDKIKHYKQDNPIPICVMNWRYDQIRPEAVDQNLITYSNNQLFDVPNRTQSPYYQDTVTIAAALLDSIENLNPKFTIPSDLWFVNWQTGVSPTVFIDFDNGAGWNPIQIVDTVQAAFSHPGTYHMKLKIQYGTIVKYAQFSLKIKLPPAEERDGGIEWPQELHEIIPITSSKLFTDPETGISAPGKATMHIFYNTLNCPGRMLRPLIIIEGYEEPGVTQSTYKRMFQLLNSNSINNSNNLTDFLYPNEYDLIYVDLEDGSDWIQRNAYVVEEVIKKVNELKAAAGSTEQNVVIGVSMGGVCGKYALLDMQNNGPSHDTRLYITYDSPLRGANIPIGTQCFMRFLKQNLGQISGGLSVPSLDLAWNAIQAPTPRQLLLYHVNSIGSGMVPVPINQDHVNFQSELDGLGTLAIRNVAISNGSGIGTSIENNILPNTSYFNLSGNKDSCQTRPNGIIYCGSVEFSVNVRSTGSTDYRLIFAGLIVVKKPFTSSLVYSEGVECVSKPFDTAPGGTSNLGIGPLGILTSLISGFGFTTTGPGLTATHHSFIPSFSSVNASEPGNLNTPQPCGVVSRCDLATTATPCLYSGLPEINQQHIAIDERIALLLVDELTTGLPALPSHPFKITPVLSTYYNEGTPLEPLIPTVTISTGKGELYLNNTGPIGYQGAGGINSPYNLIDVSTKCDAIITVENGSRLIIGAEVENKNAILHIAKGAKVIVKSGGTLRIQRNSSLEIEKQGLLKLEAGAIVELYDQPGGSLVTNGRPHIHIKNEGKLQFDGNISFQGDGYFEFDAGNIVQFPTLFNFTGSGKQYRHFKLNANAQLLKQGGQLTFSNTKFQIGCDAKPRIENFERLVLSSASFEYVNDGNCFPQAPSNSLNFSQIGFEAENGALIYALSCDFNNLRRGIRARSITNNIYVSSCNFNEGEGLDFERVRYASISSVTGNHSTLSFDEVSTGITMNNSTLTNACTICENLPRGIVDLIDVKLFTMNGGLISQSADDTYELRGIDGNLGENNVFMQNGATIQNMWIGVEINGGLPGNQFNTDFGLMRMDCARILNCSGAGIAGQDVLLDIDAGINSNGLRPNEFKKGDLDGISKFFDICYFKRQPTQILANFNYWNKFSNGGRPEPIVDFELNKKLTSGSLCTTPVTLVTTGVAAGYNASCPRRGGGDLGRDRDLPQEYKDCSISGQNLSSSFTSAWELVDSAHTIALGAESVPDFSAALSIFAPLSGVDSVTLIGYPAVCQHYTQVARTFVIASGNGRLQQPNSSLSKNNIKVTVTPNPANDKFMLTIPAGSWQVLIADNLGRQKYRQILPGGTHYISADSWPQGIYSVHCFDVSNAEMNGHAKLMIVR